MRAVIQRVSEASVRVGGEEVAAIGAGLVLLVGVEVGDGPDDAAAVADKVAGLRIFADRDGGGFERSIGDAGGAALVVSQFTLPASLRRGRRPSFTAAASADEAAALVAAVADGLRRHGIPVASGVFGAQMSVSLVNEGPATFIVDVRGGVVAG